MPKNRDGSQPSPDEIRSQCRDIQRGWSREEEQTRKAWDTSSCWLPPGTQKRVTVNSGRVGQYRQRFCVTLEMTEDSHTRLLRDSKSNIG